MALTSLPQQTPALNVDLWSGTPQFTAVNLNAANDRTAITFTPRATKTLQQIHIRIGTVTQETNGLRVSIQDLSSELPDGTEDAFRVMTSLVSDTVTASGIISSDGSDTGTKKALTAGTGYALVFSLENFQAGDDIDLDALQGWRVNNELVGNTTYTSTDAGATWASNSRDISVIVEYSDSTFELVTATPLFESLSSVTSTSATNVYAGVKFRYPVKCSTSGALIVVNAGGTTRTGTITLYDSDNNAVGTTRTLRGEANGNRPTFVQWAEGDVSLTANAFYRLVWKSTSASTTTTPTAVMDSSSDLRNANFNSGQVDAMLTVSDDAASWTDTSGTLVKFTPLLSQIDDGGGGGQNVIIRRNYGR